MIVVLDTNVVISALLSPRGNAAEIINLWQAEVFEVASSMAMLNELEHTLNYDLVKKYIKLSSEELKQFLRLFQSTSILVESGLKINVIDVDPDDNRILECALAAQASYIVTGDNHLLSLGEFEGIEILPPVSFLTLLNL